MSEKEKAKELYDNHKTLFKHYDANPRLNIGLHEYFKQCAIKTVDEIIKLSWDYRDIDLESNYDYYQGVKLEIQKL